ncbi:mechanosensitive ion channel family protein [Flavobacterium sp. ANB]|uniref:mechanosensitive ion channel family protein n=1 Tax=unclassified Flavobacterium TaxID=196869 RepID=UPI0012BA0EAA|nr:MULTISPECIES: mechanosensitive ion channel family protein [unclassified Flavobacterium]MBF4516463.1 mechanosensitive ion channel family protein [Flavobacterium sp. ANB]MTD69639.1 mechanosensitive ion channel [Flavobacterium sp. LC2016-13]
MKKELLCFLTFFTILFSLATFAQQENVQTIKPKVTKPILKGYPVNPFKDTLFYVYNKVGSFSAENRAKAITGKIKSLYENDLFKADSLKIIPSDISLDIVYKNDLILMSVLNADATAENKSVQEIAKRNYNAIKKEIVYQNENYSLLPKRLGFTALLILILGLVLLFVSKIFNRIKSYVSTHREKFLKGFTYNNVNVLTPEKQEFVIIRIIGIIKVITLIIIVYLTLPVLFSIFPATKAYTTTILKWTLTPIKSATMGFVDFLPNLFTIIVIILIFRYSLKIIKFFVDEINKENIKVDGFYSDWAKPTFNIIRFLAYAFMLVVIFPYLPGSDSPIFKGVSVFVGILFSLGSSNAIANMVAGLVITYMRPFKIGDFIKIGDVSGEVIEKTALVTRIRTPKFEDITIPNATVLSSTSTNYSANTKDSTNGLLIHTTVTIGYDVPWKDIYKALIDAALKTDMTEQTPAPFVLQTSLDDFYVSYQINVYTKEPTKQPRIYSSLHQNIQDCFNAAGIEIMSPHYNALRDGNTTTIPENYLDKNYESPTFNFKKK